MAKKQLSQTISQRLSIKQLLRTLVAVLVMFLLLVSVINVLQKYLTIQENNTELQNEKKSLEEKHAMLKKSNDYLATPEGAEQALRDKYAVVKPGEGVIMVTRPLGEEQAPPPKSKISRWWDAVVRGLGIRK